jgi:Gluconate 2-dehydrogenase subunit 3
MSGEGGEGPGKAGHTPGNMGRFDGFDVMGQESHWDRRTAATVAGRLDRPGPMRFFTPSEALTAGALFDVILAQHSPPKVPVLAMVDARLHAGSTDGWRYEDMPADAEAWRRSLAYLDEDARGAFRCGLADCGPDDQGHVIEAVKDAKTWHGLPAAHVWSLWSRYACAAFYSHPWAWNEIGFSGPAYPRGYQVLRPGWREWWEKPERDASDPVPWADRVEAAKKDHAARLGRA